MPSECCVCYAETKEDAFTCKTCAVGIICDVCRLRLMEEGYTTCPACRGHRPELVRVATPAEPSERPRPRRRRPRNWSMISIRYITYLLNFLFFQMSAVIYGYFTCFLFGFFKEGMSVWTVILVGNVSFVISYMLLTVMSAVCVGRAPRVHVDRRRY